MGLRCVNCGCTTNRACPGGCSWVSLNPPICSACVEPVNDSAGADQAVGSADLSDDYCAASPVGLHKPIWISATSGHCAACRQPFFASEAA